MAPFHANFSISSPLARQDAGRECPTLLSLVPFPRLAGPVAHTSLTQAAPQRARKEERWALMSQRELEAQSQEKEIAGAAHNVGAERQPPLPRAGAGSGGRALSGSPLTER